MSVLAFVLMAFIVTVYAVLDGYDLGVGAIAPFVARTQGERGAMMESIRPFWNGNEVWLIVAGGALFALFPLAYAAAFSAFYLPFIFILWLLMLRGIALELRGHLDNDLWDSFWDVAFSASSVLLIFFYGVTLGNLLRGLPLERSGYFVGTLAFLLNPYALLVGVLAVATMVLHGATFLLTRIEGAPAVRSRTVVAVGWWIATALYVGVTVSTLVQRWQLAGHGINAGIAVLPIVGLAALVALPVFVARGSATLAFCASTAFIVSLTIVAAGTMYPYILPKYPFGSGGLRVVDTVPPAPALATILAIAIVGLGIVCVYSGVLARRLGGKIGVPK